jgi:hypothetical protein
MRFSARACCIIHLKGTPLRLGLVRVLYHNHVRITSTSSTTGIT